MEEGYWLFIAVSINVKIWLWGLISIVMAVMVYKIRGENVLDRFNFVKPNVLIFAVILSIHFVQLKILPGSTVRPITPILLFILLFIYIYENRIRGKVCTYLTKSLVFRWAPIIIITCVYFILTPIYSGSVFFATKFMVSLVVAFLCYWMGYSFLNMKPEKFYYLVWLSFIPIIMFGFIESMGVIFFDSLNTTLGDIRNFILTYNIEKHRLHLFFSEPSFMGTYILFFVYIVDHSRFRGVKRISLYFTALLLVVLSGSLSVVMIMGTYLISRLCYSGAIRLNILLLVILGLLIGLFFSDRLMNLDRDVSSYIRFLNTVALWKMGTENYFLGSGFGGFTDYFINFLSSMNLQGSSELQAIVDGEREANQYSMLGQIFSSMGLLGLISFLFLVFAGKGRKDLIYVIPVFVAMFSALPWGLPYVWILLGIIDRGKNCENS